MPIKNKDGTPYSSYSKPNPIMNSQTLWSKEEEVVIKNKFGTRYYSSQQTEQPKTVTKTEPPQIIKPNTVVDVWCLPFIEKIGDKTKFGDKFKFKAKIITQEDLFIKLVGDKEVPIGSIIYPQNFTKRWWVVTNSAVFQDFFVLAGGISSFEPSF